MTLAYLDCFSGVAGDMWVGALLDLGLDLEALRAPVASLGLDGIELKAERVRRGGLAGVHFRVLGAGTSGGGGGGADHHHPDHPHRHLADILSILDAAVLPPVVRDRCRAVFEVLGAAEAKVHGVPIEAVHFHEVGAADTIVDVVGVVLGCHLLGIETIYSSAVVTGRGLVRCEHGEMPVPAPGALGNLLGVPLRSGGPAGECVTPTGAALLRVLVDAFEPDLRWVPDRCGYGAGSRDDPGHPNLLRITLGSTGSTYPETTLSEVTCTLDTITGEALAWLVDGALERGAVDAFVVAAHVKKGRPAHVLTVLVDEARRPGLVGFLLEESTSLGVRWHRVERSVLERWSESLPSPWGPVRYKVARLPSGIVVRRPEDDEVRRIAAAQGLSRRAVLQRLQAGPTS